MSECLSIVGKMDEKHAAKTNSRTPAQHFALFRSIRIVQISKLQNLSEVQNLNTLAQQTVHCKLIADWTLADVRTQFSIPL